MKIFYRVLHFLILVVFIIIQLVFLEYLKLYYIKFDLVMVAILAVALLDGAFYGIVSGFFAGLMLDLLTGNLVGISAFMYAVDAYLVCRIMEAGFKHKLLSYTFIIFIITEINIFISVLIRFLFNFNSSMPNLGLELLLKPVFNIILMLAVFPVMRVGSRSGLEDFESGYKSKN
ncbi:MAG: rod shape-determining protein MreD [Actinobacteria bacterium]|nr:rod shape-determining protein MreD [Actinomycetota bacterium]